MLSISLLTTCSFHFGAIGNTAKILNGLTFIRSMNFIIFFLTLLTVNGPSHLPVRSLNSLTMSPGCIGAFVTGGSFECNTLFIIVSDIIVSISTLALLRTWTLSLFYVWF